jgi:hypothetical protein
VSIPPPQRHYIGIVEQAKWLECPSLNGKFVVGDRLLSRALTVRNGSGCDFPAAPSVEAAMSVRVRPIPDRQGCYAMRVAAGWAEDSHALSPFSNNAIRSHTLVHLQCSRTTSWNCGRTCGVGLWDYSGSTVSWLLFAHVRCWPVWERERFCSCLILAVVFLTVRPYRPDLSRDSRVTGDRLQQHLRWWTGSPK